MRRKWTFAIAKNKFVKHALRLIIFYQSRSFANKSFYESHPHEDITLAKSKLETNSALCLKDMRDNIVRFCEKACNYRTEYVGGWYNCLTNGSFVTATLISSLNVVAWLFQNLSHSCRAYISDTECMASQTYFWQATFMWIGIQETLDSLTLLW